MHKNFWQHIGGKAPYRSILCLDGELPDAEFFHSTQLPIIAIDGAVNYLVPIGVKPHIAIGDMDSAMPHLLKGIEVVHTPDQAMSDLEKALEYLKAKNLLPSILVGMSGGAIDHIINNINIFIESDNIFYAPPIIGYTIHKGSKKEFQLPKDTKISLLGIPSASVSSTGLKWDLSQSHLSFPGTSSCFNRSSADKVAIEVHEGTVLVMIYLVPVDDGWTGYHSGSGVITPKTESSQP